MSNSYRSFSIFIACLSLVLLAQISGGMSCDVWCVVRNDAPDGVVQKSLDWVCAFGSTSCSRIKPGQICYRPNDLRRVASVAFNDYWQQVRYTPGAKCDLFGAATLVCQDPSFENCPATCLMKN